MFRFFVTIVIVALIGFSCRKETLLEDNGATLEFSTDTIVFDTVFSTVGSATQLLTIYNPYNKTLRIKSITLARGPSSQFSINVNGTAGVSFKDIDIAAKDSLFVFARVTIDPGNMNNPFVVTDSIIFETNGQLQDVDLVAWGQDAYYHTPDHFFPNFPPYSIIDCALPWTNDKPHVVYGWAVVDSGTVLTMNPGTRVYMHNESVLWVYSDGSLKINGTNDDQVIIQGDRLEHYYDDVPGQWGRIWLSAGSKDNVIDHAHIKNGTIGLLVDTLGASASPTLTIRNSIVENMS
ncbi:MAG: hypothetical protein KKA07_17470, partial [Bacteroidetes bacterium]|nr:hypothetical protein [Bacteroidota bacterium]